MSDKLHFSDSLYYYRTFKLSLRGLLTFTQKGLPNTTKLCQTWSRKHKEEGRIFFEKQVQKGRKDFFLKVNRQFTPFGISSLRQRERWVRQWVGNTLMEEGWKWQGKGGFLDRLHTSYCSVWDVGLSEHVHMLPKLLWRKAIIVWGSSKESSTLT